MNIYRILKDDYCDKQDVLVFKKKNYEHKTLYGWILSDGTIIYTEIKPNYHPSTGQQLDG